MYILTLKEKGTYNKQSYIFVDYDDMTTFADVAMHNAANPIEVIIELGKKEGEEDAV